jgi:hypothetical protein
MNSFSILKSLANKRVVLQTAMIAGTCGAISGALANVTGKAIGRYPFPLTETEMLQAAAEGALGVGLTSMTTGAVLADTIANGWSFSFERFTRNRMRFLNPCEYGSLKAFSDYVRVHTEFFGVHVVGGITANLLLKFWVDTTLFSALLTMAFGSIITGTVMAPVAAVSTAVLLDKMDQTVNPRPTKFR